METSHTMLQQTLEMAEALPPEERRALIELLERRMVEDRREEIAGNAARTLRAVRAGGATIGTVKDLESIIGSLE